MSARRRRTSSQSSKVRVAFVKRILTSTIRTMISWTIMLQLLQNQNVPLEDLQHLADMHADAYARV